MTAPKKTTIFLADEQTLFCEGLVAIFETARQFRVIGHCRDGRSALRLIRGLSPDVAILDLGLPKLYALSVVQQLRQFVSSPKILILSMRRDRKTVLETLRAGANGYLLKSDPSHSLLDGVREVLTGSIFVSPQFKLAEIFTTGEAASPETPYEQLSAREHQVFTMLVEGLRGKEIADRLDLSPKTVGTYRSKLMRKLNIHDVAGLVKFAIRKKLIPAS